MEQGYPCEEVIPCPVCDDRAWLFTLVDRAAGLLREYRDRELDEYTHEMYENVVVFLREMGVSE